MKNKEHCDYKILCLNEEFKCDGISCLQDRIFEEGLPHVASVIFNMDINITKVSAKTNGDCDPHKKSK